MDKTNEIQVINAVRPTNYQTTLEVILYWTGVLITTCSLLSGIAFLLKCTRKIKKRVQPPLQRIKADLAKTTDLKPKQITNEILCSCKHQRPCAWKPENSAITFSTIHQRPFVCRHRSTLPYQKLQNITSYSSTTTWYRGEQCSYVA